MGCPYLCAGRQNVVGLGAFKSYTGLWFFQGVFLTDEAKTLVNAQEGKTKAMRQWRFDSIEAIETKRVKAYILEAIQNQKEGKEILPDKKKPLEIPTELQQAFDANTALSEAFEQLNLSKKREYTDYIAEAKRAATKTTRLEKITPMILDGVGLNDKYK